MLLSLIILFVFLAVIFLPPKHGFGIALIAQSLYIVPGGFDIASYAFMVLFIKTIGIDLVIKDKITITPIMKYYFLFYFICLTSAIIFRGPLASDLMITYTRILLVVVVFSAIYKNIQDLTVLIKYIFVMLGLILLHIYTISININPFAQLELAWARLKPRGLTNQYVNPNSFSILIVWSLALLMNFFWVYRPKFAYPKKIVTIGIVFLLFLSAPLLGLLSSRSSILVLIAAIIFSVIRINVNKAIIISFVLLLLFPFVNTSLDTSNINIPFIGDVANRRFQAISEESDADNTWSRTSLASAGLTVFKNNPILGAGLGNEKYEIEKIIGNDKVSHNTFVTVLSEFGLMGVLFLLSSVFLWKNFLSYPTTLNIIIVFVLYALVHNVLLMSFTWIMLAFSHTMISLQHKDAQLLKRRNNSLQPSS